MDWKLKALALQLLDIVPFGDDIHFLLQRKITREIPRRAEVLDQLFEASTVILDHYRIHGGTTRSDAHFLEIGAGRDLAVALSLRLQGVPQITCVDLNRLARLDLVQHAATHLANKVGLPPPSIGSWEELRQFGIHYRAPATIETPAAREAKFSCFYSTDVLEHIPPSALRRTITSSASMLGRHGLSIHAIDYSDHYARSDPALSRFNFLTYSDQQWKRYNPRRHYVNRLRHSQLVRIFGDCRFTVLSESPTVCPAEGAILRNMASQFKAFTENDLFTQRAWLVCRPAPPEGASEPATR